MVSSSAKRDRPPTSPDLFGALSTTTMATSLPIWEASNILTQRQHLPWQTDPDGKLCYTRDVDRGQGAIYFWVANTVEEEHPVALAGAAALAVIETFDIRAACMHLIYAAHATRLGQPWGQEIVIDDRQIESYLGLKKRTDKSRKEKLALIEEIAKQPCKITTFISWPGRNRRKKGFTVEEGRLWHMLGTRYHYQQDLFGNKELSGITFIIKPGLWAKYFLNPDDSVDPELHAPHKTLSRSLLESVMSIWQHREGAARLMVWLLFKTQLHRQHPLHVRSLMEVAYGVQRVQLAETDYQQRKKLANTWDDDLFALHDRGWKLHFDPVTYPDEIQPCGFGRTSARRPRGFFNQLLQAKLWVSPPDDWLSSAILQAGASEDQVAELSAELEPNLSGTDVQQLRQERGWSQRKLAAISGISQGLISMIENGSRTLTPETAEILQRVFEFM